MKLFSLLILPLLLLATGCSDDASVSATRSLASVDGITVDIGIDEEPSAIDPVVVIDPEPIDPVVVVDPEPVDPVVVVDPEPIDPVIEPAPIDPDLNEPPVQCVKRRSYTLESGESSTEVKSYSGPLPADVNYNYYSWSGHPIVGSTPKGYEGQFFLYEDGEGGVSFNFIFSVDAGGSPDNKLSMDITVKNNDGSDEIILSDDRVELKKVSSSEGKTYYEAKMRYWKNTDGGIIGPVKGDDLRISVKLNSSEDDMGLVFYSADGEKISVDSKFEIVAGDNVEECSVAVDKEIIRNTCIEKEYIVRKDVIEDAKWFDEFDEMIRDKRQAVKELKAEHKVEMTELKKKIKEEKVIEIAVLKEISREISTVRKEYILDYRLSLKEINELHKKKREVLVSELNVKIKEVQEQESKVVCKRKKGFFGFLKKLFCKIVRFVGKVVGAIFKGFDGATTRFLNKCGLLEVQVTSSTQMIEIKELALSKLTLEYTEAVKLLRLEKEEFLKELKVKYTTQVKEQRIVIEKVKVNGTRLIKEMQAKHKTELRELLSYLNKKIHEFKKKAVKHQDAVHIEFTESIKECL